MTVTVKQAASRLNVSPSLIYALLRQHKLAAARIGCRGKGKWLVEEAEVERYRASCQVEAGSTPTPLRHLR